MEYSIICGLDRGESSFQVLERALAEAHHHPRSFVHLVTAIASEGEKEEAERNLRTMLREVLPVFGRKAGVRRVFVHAFAGRPEDVILELAEEQHADLIVIGRTSGARRSRPGKTAAVVLQKAPCSVYVTQPPVYDSEAAKTCSECASIRRESKGERLFCEAHSGDRIPRLMERIGSTNLVGWTVY